MSDLSNIDLLNQFKSLSVDVSKSETSIDYKEVLQFKETKLLVKMSKDLFYKDCSAYISLWNGQEWKTIYSIPYSSLHLFDTKKLHLNFLNLIKNVFPHYLFLNENFFKDNVIFFKQDRDALIKHAFDILN